MLRVRWFFVFFFVSGLCSLVDEVVWLRLAMASFGVTTPLVSIVLSVFMAGLALGSWLAGSLARGLAGGRAGRALRAYAFAEIAIGASCLAVPFALTQGRRLLAAAGGGGEWGSSAHYLAAGLLVAAALLPFSTAMGATFPLAMEAIRAAAPEGSQRSFSYLYLANVLGAACGTILSAVVLIELLGFRATLLAVGALNVALALSAFVLATRRTFPAPGAAIPERTKKPSRKHVKPEPPSRIVPGLLFATGLLSMAMEVVWVRQFTPFLGTVVYAFAAILAAYLLATFLGSALYRRLSVSGAPARSPVSARLIWSAAAAAALLPLAFADPRMGLSPGPLAAFARAALGLGPFCFVAGLVTPMLVDRWSGGDPKKAGNAYAVNVLGCIVGPLIAGFFLLPALGERGSLITLSLPFFIFAVFASGGSPRSKPIRRKAARGTWTPLATAVGVAAALALVTEDFETIYPHRQVLRDPTATVIAAGDGMMKHLLVNGYGMTVLTPVTKMMAHLPLAFHETPPRNALVICFGMGTSFRSALSWRIPVTAVELIPSVPVLFGYYHADAAQVAASPGARIVIDDGRRFLERTAERFDVITLDPPPPIEAAGSSLLYSREFFVEARARLAPGGILQVWFPGGDRIILCSVAKALRGTFPFVRVFRAHLGSGYHFLAADMPIRAASGAELAARQANAAAADMLEWEPGITPVVQFGKVLAREIPIDVALGLEPGVPPLSDDGPINEYFLLRRLGHPPRDI